ncbi:hypothetical protein M3J09_011043 [Ascochyta lentis]
MRTLPGQKSPWQIHSSSDTMRLPNSDSAM